MSKYRKSYRQILKTTSIFGGVQLFQILIQIVRSKFIALYIGPMGMGLFGLFTSTLGLIGGMTNFGIGTSSVKNLSEAYTLDDNEQINKVVFVLRKLVLITGILGAVIMVLFSPWLSEITFGNKNYTLSFIWLSITLIFNQITSGQLAVLQGMRHIKYLAKANLYGAIISLVITIPIYYKFGIKGIVPVIILTSIFTLLFSWYFSNKIGLENILVKKNEAVKVGKSILSMGFLISLGGLFTTGASYALRVFIANYGSVTDVGMYNAGFTIITSYVGLIFNAMATDYYPRLSSVSSDNILCKEIINHQAEIALLILSPILLVFIVTIKWAIVLLYSNQFSAINTMMLWSALGMFFKLSTWVVGFLFLAKGDKKIFFWSELISNTYMLILNILGYVFWGLNGLGISFFVGYIIAFFQVYFISKIQYNFSFTYAFLKLFVVFFTFSLICFFNIKYIIQPYSSMMNGILIIFSFFLVFHELDKRIEIKSILFKIVKQKKNK